MMMPEITGKQWAVIDRNRMMDKTPRPRPLPSKEWGGA